MVVQDTQLVGGIRTIPKGSAGFDADSLSNKTDSNQRVVAVGKMDETGDGLTYGSNRTTLVALFVLTRSEIKRHQQDLAPIGP
jgi:hypothetical protein